jgi:hypothetical protein
LTQDKVKPPTHVEQWHSTTLRKILRSKTVLGALKMKLQNAKTLPMLLEPVEAAEEAS